MVGTLYSAAHDKSTWFEAFLRTLVFRAHDCDWISNILTWETGLVRGKRQLCALLSKL